MWKINLPALKKGDVVRIVETNNLSCPEDYNGYTAKVTRARGSSNYVSVTMLGGPREGASVSLYYSGPADVFTLANRKDEIKCIKAQIKELEQQIAEHKKRLVFLEKYKDEAEFVADKIDKLLKAKSVNSKAEILRELKKSNYI